LDYISGTATAMTMTVFKTQICRPELSPNQNEDTFSEFSSAYLSIFFFSRIVPVTAI
jgi:hypothetical protein